MCVQILEKSHQKPIFHCRSSSTLQSSKPFSSFKTEFFALEFARLRAASPSTSERPSGFGCSPIANDYKIVRAYSDSEFDDAVNRVEVFSLSRGSWKGIELGNLKGVKLCSESVTRDGAVFWFGVKFGAEEMGEDDGDEVKDDPEDYGYEAEGYEYDIEEDEDDTEWDEYNIEEYGYDTEEVEYDTDGVDIKEREEDADVIVSFDIAKEVFTLLPRPDVDYNQADEKLTVYDNKPAILCDNWEDDDDDRSGLIDLWVMEEGTRAVGERWSWAKIYTSSPCPYTLESMTIWRNQIVCKASSKDDNLKGRDVLYLLNIITNEAKRFDIPNCGYGYVHSMCNYVESLVSLGTYC
ncbi:uncharacterized protein LOC129303292 isoform X2 [Prosopis cineraria]|uniref:uncharacterized protein LOC129303292 isoform X2 n=1 Tax=Prosopis cineraria TaxID=364024 RepID=UPI00240FEB3A|nr:uncharacterized protein LOC129303292 isoform X2 [Prosopis cineraria]